MTKAFVVAIVGAESTGKTTLARELGVALGIDGRRVAVVPEYLREFCDRLGRTPVCEEQAHIASEQTRRIAAAAATHDIVIADTTALMIAVYSDQVFGDSSLYAQAQRDHRRANLTLLTALDLPWHADGLQRDGPQVREPVDERVRAALRRADSVHSIVCGMGEDRLAIALKAVEQAFKTSSTTDEMTRPRRWQWVCERCGDGDCERHLLPGGAS